ncbi:M15 family metallopeptidase [Sanguibacter antarcticus]|uniref:D-alanyl-D-alanine carboxypeptidase-like protein n=1 Tax=Sanguibacter antarcticus TaxID=372484 RepID=A0A2A9E0P6_9MICO|nr:M15 family metallopeptidase [Sanguibacter antarcticus]PFG32414.1 D-alanyl-D-alanine carboxypeptidase-like protein [Sanguibacter antarcticus]
MDGIAAITQRITEIQATIGSFSPPVPNLPDSARSGSFGQALGLAVDDLSKASAAGAGAASWSAAGVPADLARYGNGEVPRAELVNVAGTGHRLWAPAGKAFEQLLADAAKDGVSIGITDSYRSYDAQVDVAERKGLYSQGGLAATPGTSPHGWGIALDLDMSSQAQAWMRSNAGRYGFVEDTPREPWHWVYRK